MLKVLLLCALLAAAGAQLAYEDTIFNVRSTDECDTACTSSEVQCCSEIGCSCQPAATGCTGAKCTAGGKYKCILSSLPACIPLTGNSISPPCKKEGNVYTCAHSNPELALAIWKDAEIYKIVMKFDRCAETPKLAFEIDWRTTNDARRILKTERDIASAQIKVPIQLTSQHIGVFLRDIQYANTGFTANLKIAMCPGTDVEGECTATVEFLDMLAMGKLSQDLDICSDLDKALHCPKDNCVEGDIVLFASVFGALILLGLLVLFFKHQRKKSREKREKMEDESMTHRQIAAELGITPKAPAPAPARDFAVEDSKPMMQEPEEEEQVAVAQVEDTGMHETMGMALPGMGMPMMAGYDPSMMGYGSGVPQAYGSGVPQAYGSGMPQGYGQPTYSTNFDQQSMAYGSGMAPGYPSMPQQAMYDPSMQMPDMQMPDMQMPGMMMQPDVGYGFDPSAGAAAGMYAPMPAMDMSMMGVADPSMMNMEMPPATGDLDMTNVLSGTMPESDPLAGEQI